MKKILFFILVPVTLFAYDIEVYFSPRGGCRQAIIEEIKDAKSEVLIAIYAFTEEELALSLVDAKKRGVDVKIIFDKRQSKGKYSKASYFINAGFPVKYSGGKGLFHHKFAVIDCSILITGSFNWTKAAEQSNRENLLIIRSPGVALQYRKEFRRLWGKEGFGSPIKDSIELKRVKVEPQLNFWGYFREEWNEFLSWTR